MSTISIQRKVGLRIRELRTERGLSQERFAYSIDMARTYFTEVENGKRNVSLENLERILACLFCYDVECAVNYLLCYTLLTIIHDVVDETCNKL